MDFQKRYNALNAAQKKAVDTINGPVMVIAGPGTGKTELLSMRTATILQKTDTLPENILCLTFTESGASAMRERLAGIVGKDAYKVAIHTFHSFGTEVINQNAEFFYHGAQFRPADELSRHDIVQKIFDGLGHNNILNKKMNGDYTYLRETLTVISELKKSGLTSDELLEVLDANEAVIEKTESLLRHIFAQKITKATAEQLAPYVKDIAAIPNDLPIRDVVPPLSQVLADSLQRATDDALETSSTKPITSWRNQWFKKNEHGQFVLKSRERQAKLRAISSIYEQYLARMSEAELFDFDDMILRVVHAVEIFDELRFNLQEKYQYIMIDEFQDTNMAQMRIVSSLTNNEAHGDTPNIMVVGDDDQAIYSFQGADISNILHFRENYPKAVAITLTDNYRSTSDVLAEARGIIVQGDDRLELRMPDINKQLTANNTRSSSVRIVSLGSSGDERQWVVQDIKERLAAGETPSDIAVLTRKHQELEALLPYFHQAGVSVQYERRDNVLELAPVQLIEQLARVLIGISIGNHKNVNGMLGRLLAHPAWGIAPQQLWQLSMHASESHSDWLVAMTTFEPLQPLQEWLIATALSIPHTPLETMLDIMIGVPDDKPHDFVSPLYNYFFDPQDATEKPEQYLLYLEALRAVRTATRAYKPAETPTLLSFIECVDLHKSIGSGITSVRPASGDAQSVQLMTAHKSKGLEFNRVYIVDSIDTVWGERARSRSRMLTYPENLRLTPAGDSPDERLRLFYVAATRAKQHLTISYATTDDSGKRTSPAAFLVSSKQPVTVIPPMHDAAVTTQQVETAWYGPLVAPHVQADLASLIKPTLASYKLSVTHLTNFLDVTRGGPQAFLLHNLLRFPQAMSAASAYGSAIHATLQRAHQYVSVHGEQQPIEDILQIFDTQLATQHLSEYDFEKYSQKGSDELHAFLAARYDSFDASQRVEQNFASQQVVIGDAHLSGALDVIQVLPGKQVTVTDYKTGKPALSWSGKTEYEKIKLHKYRQQLMFYKLLVEHARDYRGHTVGTGILQFVQPTPAGEIVQLDTSFDSDDLERFTQLIQAVWKRITTLDLPDTSHYDQSLKGILAFEQDLIDGAL